MKGTCLSVLVYLFREKGQVILHTVKDAVLLLQVLGVLMRKIGYENLGYDKWLIQLLSFLVRDVFKSDYLRRFILNKALCGGDWTI